MMRRQRDPREATDTGSGSRPTRAACALFALLAGAVSSPAWASYSDGFATLMLLYFGAMVGAVAVVVSLVLCCFGVFRHKKAFRAYVLLMSTGAGFIALIACFDRRGVAFLIAILLVLVLLSIVVAPASIQYGFHRRKMRRAR